MMISLVSLVSMVDHFADIFSGVLMITTWKDAEDDAVMTHATDTFGNWAETEARKRGILDKFVYLNYANGKQPVYERSVTAEDLEKMQLIKKTYDPSGTFEKLWKGGFKLPKVDSNIDTEARVVDHGEL